MKVKILIIILLAFTCKFAYSYRIDRATISSGGGARRNTDYKIYDCIGQVSSITYSSLNNKIYSGFILPPLPEIEFFYTRTLPSGISLISVPVTPKSNDLSQLGISKIAIWDTAERKYKYYNLTPEDQIFELKRGRGYWVLTTEKDIKITAVSDPEPEEGGYFSIELKEGWNQIGHPFKFDVLFSDMRIRKDGSIKTILEAEQGNLVKPYSFAYKTQQDGFQIVTLDIPGTLKKFEPGFGYFIYSLSECELLIPGEKTTPKYIPAGENNWVIPVKVEINNIADSIYVGVSERYISAVHKPPSPFQDVSIYTERGAIDMVDRLSIEKKERIEFEFTVETNLTNSILTLKLDKSNLPEGYRVKLIDVSTDQILTVSEYRYNSGLGGVRKFKLIVEKPLVELSEDKELKFEYTYPYPNPYCGKVSEGASSKKKYQAEGITFRYKASGNIQKVVIEIYNIKGKLIERFEDLTIDGEANYNFPEKLSNGVYIYRITISNGEKSVRKTGKLVILK